jgi:hypothetical protein
LRGHTCTPAGERWWGTVYSGVAPNESVQWSVEGGPGTVTVQVGPLVQMSFPTPGLRVVSATVTDGGGQRIVRKTIFVSPPGILHRPHCELFRVVDVHVGNPSRARGLVRAEGRVLLPDGSPAAGVVVALRSPSGRVVAQDPTDGAGHFEVPYAIGRRTGWSLLPLAPARGAEVPVRLPAQVVVRAHVAGPREGGVLLVRGRILPALAGKLMQLEWEVARGRWRPLVQTRTRSGGAYSLGYHFRRSGAAYAVRMRVVAPQDRGWPFPSARSSGFVVRVGAG